MKKAAALFALVLASIALVACGGSDDDATTNETQPQGGAAAGGNGNSAAEGKSAGSAAVVDFEADRGGGIAYTSDSATAQAGKVTVNFTNPQGLSHDVAIEDPGGKTVGKTEIIGEGSDSTVVDLKPGEYTFYCSVPGHREAGMEGTLSVE
jgi:plastocyanin